MITPNKMGPVNIRNDYMTKGDNKITYKTEYNVFKSLTKSFQKTR